MNKIKNDEHDTTNSAVEKTENLSELHLEKMRYNNNSLSYILGLLGIVFSVAACFIALNSLNPIGFKTVLKVVLNIFVLLIGFLTAEKVKVYQKKFSYVSFALGGIAILRMFWYPLTLMVKYNGFVKMLNAVDGKISQENFDNARHKFGEFLGVTVMGALKDGEIVKTGYFTTNGYIRAIVLFVLLGCCAACFIFAGLINYVKSTKLTNYLARQNVKN